MWRRSLIAKVLLIFGGFVFVGLGLFLLMRFSSYSNEFRKWETDRPISSTIDFSKASPDCQLIYNQTCTKPHGTILCLVPSSKLLLRNTSDKLIENLRFSYIITDERGHSVVSGKFYGKMLDIDNQFVRDGAIPLLRLNEFPAGRYLMQINVSCGSTILQGSEQWLEVRYWLTNQERMPSFLALVKSILCFLIALIQFFACILLVWWESREVTSRVPADLA